MLRATLATLFITLGASVAGAFEIDTMSEQERDIFRAEIRDYLLENPEVLMEAIAVLEARRAEQAASQESVLLEENRKAIFEDGYSWIGGNPDGDVTVVEFLDYRCGFCKRAHPEVQALLESDGNIRLIVKEFPILGPDSELASRYAIAVKMVAGDEAYATVHDELMELSGAVNEAALGRISRGVGIDHDAVVGRMGSAEVSQIIAANRALAQTLQIQGTPSFIMGEVFVRGYVELDEMQNIIESIRAERG